MEQELLALPWHPRSPHVFSGVPVARALVFGIMFFVVVFCPFVVFSFGHYSVCPSSMYGF